MNRIVLIGNGFDLAHGLHTSYKDFIDWYWAKIYNFLSNRYTNSYEDDICRIELNIGCKWDKFLQCNYNRKPNEFYQFVQEFPNINIQVIPLFKEICDSLAIQDWVDIENIYYTQLNKIKDSRDKAKKLNKELDIIRTLLAEYLSTEITVKDSVKNSSISKKILEPFNPRDIMVSNRNYIEEHFSYWFQHNTTELVSKLHLYDKVGLPTPFEIDDFKNKYSEIKSKNIDLQLFDVYTELFLVPDDILLLNFNYTKTAELYKKYFNINYIHGSLQNTDSLIFGYGDELDKDYQTLQEYNDNEYLKNIKSVKYMEADNYRKLLAYIESAPYQIYIMGHSCGNSDRTLLNTLFEHRNCVSIKPFYYKDKGGQDNYLDIVQNILRNFTDMKQMRNKVVNKTYCEPLPQNE